MYYYSLEHRSPEVDFRTATVLGQAPDKGLYFPERIPRLAPEFVDALPAHSLPELAAAVLGPLTEGSLPEPILRSIVTDALSFDIPLVPLSEDLHVLELFHGPTLAFKDVGARFMSRCLGYFSGEPVTVLVATSGDTGGAVASGFDGVKGVKVVILYPKGKVSPVQELQLTTCGENVTALEVDGTFDDCQRMVKEAFADRSLTGLTSANSINVARWLPQQVYYWWAYRQWDHAEPPVFVVPSGNFGNICAGLLAFHEGMPASHFLAACNANDTVPRFMQTGTMDPHPAVATLSNAMDVAVPSNFGRILELFERRGMPLGGKVSSLSVGDEATIESIRELYRVYGYVADPHTAVGYDAWKTYRKTHPGAKGILLSTAHPVKFAPTIESALGIQLDLPESVKALYEKPARKVAMGTDFAELKAFLLGAG
ncbi:threonine synthase [Dinghuibacter silviterrae]|uniref:Threonine synthase n=1 Tax=Dinghuibacter silviterrae TaxID=1539049 RepID=A0A4R8DSL3_9BACT|nr:threonine synthase [Dinghuibacter silviterrae]TDX01049.1 threonine synthase [Dinghuibacter silviterrae]